MRVDHFRLRELQRFDLNYGACSIDLGCPRRRGRPDLSQHDILEKGGKTFLCGFGIPSLSATGEQRRVRPQAKRRAEQADLPRSWFRRTKGTGRGLLRRANTHHRIIGTDRPGAHRENEPRRLKANSLRYP